MREILNRKGAKDANNNAEKLCGIFASFAPLRFLIVFLLFLSCSVPKQTAQENTGPKEGFTASGFRYLHHLRNDGPKPAPGDFVLFDLHMSNGDSVMYDSRQQPNMPRLQVPAPGKGPAQASPVVEGLLLMAEGDSLTVWYPLDSLGGPPPAGYENTEFFLYTMVLNDIQSAEEYREEKPAFVAEEKERLAGRLAYARLETRFLWKQYRTGLLGDRLLTSPSGMEYIPLEMGSGPVAENGQWLSLHYLCISMADGAECGNTFERNREQFFRIGGGSVLPQWEEAALRFPAGSALILFVPPGIGAGMELSPAFNTSEGLVFFLEFKQQVN